MDFIRSAALSVCTAAVAGSLLYLVSPAGSMRRVYRVGVAAFFLCCIVSSVAGVDFDFSSSALDGALDAGGYSSGETLSQALGQQVVDQFERTIADTIRTELEQKEVYPQNIFVSAHVRNGGSIEMEHVTISLDTDYRGADADVKLIVYNAVGFMPEVIYEG